MNNTCIASRRRALKVLVGAGLAVLSGGLPSWPRGARRQKDATNAVHPLLMDGHVHVTNRIYWEKIDPWTPQSFGWDYARARAAGVNCIIDNIGTYGDWNYNYTPK